MEKQSTSPRSLRKDKGVAGLTILLSAVAMVFIIGFLVMVFAIIGGSLQDNALTPTSATTTGEAGWINSSGYTVDDATAPGFRSFAITSITNETGGFLIASGNYTYTSAGVITNATAVTWTAVEINYTYVYSSNNTATESIGETVTSIAGVAEWFPIIITITVMVALILLTVIIIVTIRSSGILAGGQ